MKTRPVADIFGANKGSPPNLIADGMAALGEFVGMAVFIFLALSGVQAALEAPTGIPTDRGFTPDQIQSIAFSFGASVTVALFICGPISGGVLNPAILLSLVLTGNINWLRGILFFFAEMVGAILGAYFCNFVTAHDLQGVNLLSPGFNYAQGFFAEALLTCTLCLTVLFVIVDKSSLSDFAPFVVGTSIFICHLVGAPIDGTSVNPARSFAASLVAGKWANHWIFWFGPLIGAVFAVMIYLSCKILEDNKKFEEGFNRNVRNENGDQTYQNGDNTQNNANYNSQDNGMYHSTSNNIPTSTANPTTQNTSY
ncbi:aquaporin-like protein [Helicostylum pulchrum]|nr:aquaporin-like protein [Helicostylum pulchrum]